MLTEQEGVPASAGEQEVCPSCGEALTWFRVLQQGADGSHWIHVKLCGNEDCELRVVATRGG